MVSPEQGGGSFLRRISVTGILGILYQVFLSGRMFFLFLSISQRMCVLLDQCKGYAIIETAKSSRVHTTNDPLCQVIPAAVLRQGGVHLVTCLLDNFTVFLLRHVRSEVSEHTRFVSVSMSIFVSVSVSMSIFVSVSVPFPFPFVPLLLRFASGLFSSCSVSILIPIHSISVFSFPVFVSLFLFLFSIFRYPLSVFHIPFSIFPFSVSLSVSGCISFRF